MIPDFLIATREMIASKARRVVDFHHRPIYYGSTLMALRHMKKLFSPWVLVTGFLLALIAGGVLFLYTRPPRYEVQYKRGLLHLQSGNAEEAVKSFRAALDKKPDLMAARKKMVQALATDRQFEEAGEALDEAAAKGLDENESALLRASLYSTRASYRLQSAGEEITPDLCDSIIKEDITPAIDLLQQAVDQADEKALVYDRLGDLYMQQSRILGRKWELLREEIRLAANLGDEEETAAMQAAAGEAVQQMGSTQKQGIQAYQRAIDADPDLEAPRLALARHVLSMFAPRPQTAKSVLQPIIDENPAHKQARTLLAGAERVAENYDKALEHLDALSEEDKKDDNVIKMKTQILVDSEQWEEAASLSQQLLKSKPDDRQVNYLRGRALLHTGGYEQAANHLQKAVSGMDQPWPRARFPLAESLRKSGKREQAISEYRQTLQGISETMITSVSRGRDVMDIQYKANLVLAQELADEQPELALENAANAFRVRPHKSEAFAALNRLLKDRETSSQDMESIALVHAGALAKRGELSEALEVCETTISESDEALRIRHLRARLLVQSGEYRKAVQAYQELSNMADTRRYDFELASVQRQLGHTEEARQIYKGILESDSSNVRALAGLVGVHLSEGETDRAVALLTKADQELGSDTVRALLMGLYLREGQTDKAIELARAFVEAKPDQAPVHLVLGQLLWRAGKTDEARKEFDKARELKPDYMPAYARGLIDLQEGKASEAVELFKKATEQFSEQAAPVLYLAVALQADGKLDQAIEVLEEGQSRQALRRSGTARWFLAVMRAAKGEVGDLRATNILFRNRNFGMPDDRERLLKRLSELEQAQAQEAAVLLNLSVALRQHGNTQAAINVANQLETLLPDEPVLVCRRLALLDSQGQHETAVNGYQNLIERHPDFMFARLKLSDSFASHDETDAAARVLEEALEHASEQETSIIHLQLAQLYEQLDQVDRAMASYRIAIKSERTAAMAYNNLAWLQITRKDNADAALPLAEKAQELSGGRSPQILDTLGWIHHLKGNTEKAIEHLEQARKALPQMPTVRYHLGAAYAKAGRTEEAKSELQEALAISQDFPEAEDASKLLNSL